MGSRNGHVGPGFGFLIIGLWQLYNHIKLHSQSPKSYNPPLWFPFRKIRHLELYLMIIGSWISILMELFVGPYHHHPLDPNDFTIPLNHLHNFEHATISFSIFLYAILTIYFDYLGLKAAHTLSLLLGSLAFGVEFLLFYLHSTDHSGVEGQYHWLLQVAISICFITTVMGLGFPRSFSVGFVRSTTILLQGVWLNVLGIMLYTKRFIPKGCSLESDDGRLIVPCVDHLSLHRAKALVNLEFAWCVLAVVGFSIWFYIHLGRKYPEVQEYECLGKKGYSWGSPKELEDNPEMFVGMGDLCKAKDLER